MNYYELRKQISKIIPRRSTLHNDLFKTGAIKEKGRKSNYYQFDLTQGQWLKNERLLNTEEVRSFAEISLRAAACPMPFNLDVWDGLRCGFGCRYCYADNFRASLYTSFFDNSKSMGLRHCNSDYYKHELDKLLINWGKEPNGNDIQRAICMGIPIRFGIRFEDFLPIEGKKKVSLELLKHLASVNYPLMINTKSDLVGRDDYVKALTDNEGQTAVHITLISSNDTLLKKLEPGAPSYRKRLSAMEVLSSAGVRVVARIEPYMVFINDDSDFTNQYIDETWDAGVRHITFDTYSYSANNPGIRQSFYEQGYDFERMFLLTTDSQQIGSLLLSKFMDLFRAKGFSCSTFDLGNVPDNDDHICCEVGDHFQGHVGFNYGSSVEAIRFIQSQKGKSVTWNQYKSYVEDQGGFLSDELEKGIHQLWNLDGNTAFAINWAKGIEPVGRNEEGIIWKFDDNFDFREKFLEEIL